MQIVMQNKCLTNIKGYEMEKSLIPDGAAPASEASKVMARKGVSFWAEWPELLGCREAQGAPLGREYSSGFFLCPQPKHSNLTEVLQ